MRAVVMVLRGRFRQYRASWLALSVLVAVTGGFVLATVVAAHQTADAFPRFVARHGYDVIAYSGQPLPQLVRLPHVASSVPMPASFAARASCASCHKPIDVNEMLINEVPPSELPRMVSLLSGRMPDQSDPREVLASFTLAKDNGVRVGSVIQAQLVSPAQLINLKVPPDRSPVMNPALRVVGIVAAESEFPSGASVHYDLYATPAFAAAVNHRAGLQYTYYVRLTRGAADMADFDSRARSANVYGTYDLDAAAGAVEASIRPQVIGWYALAAVVAVSAWPAVRQARSPRTDPPLSAPVVAAVGRGAALAGLPATALVGIRHALERGRDGQPVGTALLGMVMAVAALCATAVFGASLTHLVSSPELYGAPFQAYFSSDGLPGSQAKVTGPLLDSLRRDRAISQITLGAFVEVDINGEHVRTVVMTPLRGPALLSAVDGRLPHGDRDIMLGVATMRAIGARLGGTVRVTVSDPAGAPHVASFHVIGRASLNAGTGGLGNGAVMTTSAFTGAQCPPGPGQPACQHAVRNGMATVVLVRPAPGAAGQAALARHIRQYPDLTAVPAKPTVLVNFGESVNFPLLFGVALSLFGAATMLHLLLVSQARRHRETGLLKSLGFVRRQVAAAVCWQATTVALVGIIVGAPIGIAVGRVLWRVFATNFGVVPVPVAEPLLLTALAAGVLAAANVLAVVPALLAARCHPGQLLRAE